MSLGNDNRSLKLYEALQNDLKNLCMETRKKYPHIKDVSIIIQFICLFLSLYVI